MISKTRLNKAVRLFQLYAGSSFTSIATAQKMYRAAIREATKIANVSGISQTSAVEQIAAEASRRGRIIPTPGKDF